VSSPRAPRQPDAARARRGSARRRAVGAVAWLLIGSLGLAATGCIHRSLTITSRPAGALVYVNDALKGQTPVSYDFLWYGWYRVALHKEGYERLHDRRLLRAPLRLWIPWDLVMELVPWTIQDAQTWSYVLTPVEEPAVPVPPELVQLRKEQEPPAAWSQPAGAASAAVEASQAAVGAPQATAEPSPNAVTPPYDGGDGERERARGDSPGERGRWRADASQRGAAPGEGGPPPARGTPAEEPGDAAR
jgi:hypothetical protein